MRYIANCIFSLIEEKLQFLYVKLNVCIRFAAERLDHPGSSGYRWKRLEPVSDIYAYKRHPGPS